MKQVINGSNGSSEVDTYDDLPNPATHKDETFIVRDKLPKPTLTYSRVHPIIVSESEGE
jgi:hypothetical protein